MSNADYAQRRAEGDSCLPQVKAILGQLFYRDDLTFEDQKHNTDLMMLRMGDERFGVRLRNYSAYLHKDWRTQFTIRYRTAGGFPTEFDKVIYNHWGSYFFYGFMNQKRTYIIKWILGDYDAFRVYAGKCMSEDPFGFIRNHKQSNYGDNDSDFLVFDREEVPGFVVMDSEHFIGFGNNWNEKRKYLDIDDIPEKYREKEDRAI